ncbi:phage tail protein [Jiella avicenniae]|uniref:Tail fiber protein n=1 Tax=Jiella avicenniae TaxID=2907202 RepID=A0A9X1P089_9HYPH|nr:tail fiber protein [Jiella avicenniae]MCE7026961.1 tail fiber protein [Jiella avicenniae]
MARKSIFSRYARTFLAALTLAALTGGPSVAVGQELYIAQILPIANGFCPRYTLEASGQLLPINQNQALFALLGTNYGGDGQTNFALPDMRGREIIHLGQGAGLPQYGLAQRAGSSTVTLTASNMPAHSHQATATLDASGSVATSGTPTGNSLAMPAGPLLIYDTTAPAQPLNTDSISVSLADTGSGQPFQHQSPTLVIRWCIVTQGYFPSRN